MTFFNHPNCELYFTLSGDFGTEYPNDDGSIYKHEGVDYSGQYFNVMKDWYKGLWGETIYGE